MGVEKKDSYSLVSVLCHKVNLRESEVLVKLVVYPIAIPLAWLLLNYTRIRANHVTSTGLVVAICGGVAACIFGEPWLSVAAYGVAYLLDFVDGRVARAHGGTPMGVYLDLMTDRIAFSSLILSLGYFHLQSRGAAEIWTLLALFQVYVLLDIHYFACRKMKESPGYVLTGGVKAASGEIESNAFKASFGSIRVWLPSRLGAPIWGGAAFLVTDNALVAYISMLVASLLECVLLLRQLFVRRSKCRQ